MTLKKDKVVYAFGDNHYQAPFTLMYADLSSLTHVNHGEENFPKEFFLAQNYPNPFNPKTLISYQLTMASHVDLKVYDILGRVVKTLVDGI